MSDKFSKASLALIGMPGSGKSTIGLMLSSYWNLDFVDLDKCIEQQAGMSIKQYFADYGEVSFRKLEHKVLTEKLVAKRSLISTGGGIVLNPQNRQALKDNIFTAYLYAQPQVIYNRLKFDKKRPLLQNVKDKRALIQQLFEQRHSLYEQTADLILVASKLDFYVIVDQIKARMPHLSK